MGFWPHFLQIVNQLCGFFRAAKHRTKGSNILFHLGIVLNAGKNSGAKRTAYRSNRGGCYFQPVFAMLPSFSIPDLKPELSTLVSNFKEPS